MTDTFTLCLFYTHGYDSIMETLVQTDPSIHGFRDIKEPLHRQALLSVHTETSKGLWHAQTLLSL